MKNRGLNKNSTESICLIIQSEQVGTWYHCEWFELHPHVWSNIVTFHMCGSNPLHLCPLHYNWLIHCHYFWDCLSRVLVKLSTRWARGTNSYSRMVFVLDPPGLRLPRALVPLVARPQVKRNVIWNKLTNDWATVSNLRLLISSLTSYTSTPGMRICRLLRESQIRLIRFWHFSPDSYRYKKKILENRTLERWYWTPETSGGRQYAVKVQLKVHFSDIKVFVQVCNGFQPLIRTISICLVKL